MSQQGRINKALDKLYNLHGVHNSYLRYALSRDEPLTFYEWLASDIQKPINLFYGERKLFDKMHRIIFKNSYAKDYKF